MHYRYQDERIVAAWSDEAKLLEWEDVELAVVLAREILGRIPRGTHERIKVILKANPPDIEWWHAREKETDHDLQAFLDERLRHLLPELQCYLHEDMTSYDTEEPAFVFRLYRSAEIVQKEAIELLTVLKGLALKYRFAPMQARTHGQEAELKTFGARCACWYRDLILDLVVLDQAESQMKYAKLSGAVGNYTGMDPELERKALSLFMEDLRPYVGATQILPRELFVSLSGALVQIVGTINKIATVIRLMARSGRPTAQEPFGKKQKGSSAMPHKKNTIKTEKIEGMSRMAQGYQQMIVQNISTWEERAIEQSSVERVAWQDLFHVTVHSITTMRRVLQGLRVYPDNMLYEIAASRGTYASVHAKELLKELLSPHGYPQNVAYRIVQLAAFCVFSPDEESKKLRENLANDLTEADRLLVDYRDHLLNKTAISSDSIQSIIPAGRLFWVEDLDIAHEDIEVWNTLLRAVFTDEEAMARWNEIFKPSFILKGEKALLQSIFPKTIDFRF